jgi:hypothetical protein
MKAAMLQPSLEGIVKKPSHWTLGFLLALTGTMPVLAAPEVEMQGPQFTAEGQLLRPENYREWVCIGTGINMAYGPLQTGAPRAHPPFTNVFVNPTAYKSFLQSGTWPDKTIFILEIRGSVSVNKAQSGGNGYYQGELLGIEAEVKDEQRFAGKWAFFGLEMSAAAGAQIPVTASCYSCHAKNAGVDNTFVQFYPVLRDVAKAKGTLKDVPEVF